MGTHVRSWESKGSNNEKVLTIMGHVGVEAIQQRDD